MIAEKSRKKATHPLGRGNHKQARFGTVIKEVQGISHVGLIYHPPGKEVRKRGKKVAP